jgi:hypothetical protein
MRSHRQKVQEAMAQKMKQGAHNATMRRQAVRSTSMSVAMSVSIDSIAEQRQLARMHGTNVNRGVGACISVKATQVGWVGPPPRPPYICVGPTVRLPQPTVTSAGVTIMLPKAPTKNLSDLQYSIGGQQSNPNGPGGRRTSADKAFEVASTTQGKSFHR